MSIEGLKEINFHDWGINNYYEQMESSFSKWSFNYLGFYVVPNFGCVYSRDRNFGRDLIDIAVSEKITGCVEEHTMYLYVRHMHGIRFLDEYVEKFQPKYVQGVSDDNLSEDYLIGRLQKQINNEIAGLIEMDLYLKHV